jgi:glycosyltransferase involved in cell wall biosynthesis
VEDKIENLLSICIPTYNRWHYLQECLQHVIPQAKLLNIPIYISDNCSTDNTINVIIEAQKNYSLLFYKQQDHNMGIDNNMFNVFQLSETRYCWLLGDDDIIKPNALKNILSVLQENMNLDIILLNTEFISPTSEIIPDKKLINISENKGYSNYLAFFNDCVDKLPCGNIVLSRNDILTHDYHRFIGTYHAYAGAIWNYLLSRYKLNKVNHILVLSTPYVLLRTGDKSWNDYYIQVHFIAIPRWYSLLPVEYKSIADIKLKEYFKWLFSNRHLFMLKHKKMLKLFTIGRLISKTSSLLYRIKLFGFSLIPQFIYSIVYLIYKKIVFFLQIINNKSYKYKPVIFKYVKKILGPKTIYLIKRLSYNRIIINHYKSKYSKYALLSYIKQPFIRYYYSHTNSFEATSWGSILNELGYQVDVMNYDSFPRINLEKYHIICGGGDVFKNYYENSKLSHKATNIFYSGGMHVCHQNNISLNRVKDVFNKKGVWLPKSARFVEKTWTHNTTLVDGIVALGNDVCANSFKKHYSGPVFSLNAPFFKTLDAMNIINSRSTNAKYHFLWFGSSGLIHKGLDLLLDYFKSRPNIYLHICGEINSEPDFIKVYRDELYHTANIINHGFIDINTCQFSEILQQCAFVIFPTCSEGGSPSVVTCIGNGGLIPIITKESTLSTGCEIFINGFTNDDIDQTVTKALSMTDQQIKELQIANLNYILKHHSTDVYYNRLKEIISRVLL